MQATTATCPWKRRVPCSRVCGMSLRSGTGHGWDGGNFQWAHVRNALPCPTTDSAHFQVQKGALRPPHLLQPCKPGLIKCFCTKALCLAVSEVKEQLNTSNRGSKVQLSQHRSILPWAGRSVRLRARTFKCHVFDKTHPDFSSAQFPKRKQANSMPRVPHALQDELT